MSKIVKDISLIILMSVFLFGNVYAAEKTQPVEQKHHKVVIQVSTDNPRTQKIALNNAVNLQKLYGMDNIDIEIVAYGPGLGLLTTKSKQADRVKSLALQDITFSACRNTMEKVKRKTGKLPVILEGVQTVPAGVARIIELQEQGYAYIRP
ncbi:MAG TPA: hypothetical protein ENI65_06520 [Gammaproteobacteria bacterium]|nr:hypothetical protein [Gammaproteobacteria bacterium]